LHAWVKGECERQALHRTDLRFTRRQVRELTGWGDTQLRVHLGRLVELEYLIEHGGRRGQVFSYELAYGGEGEDGQPFLMGLLDAGLLASGMTASSRGEEGNVAAPSRGQNRGDAVPTRSAEMAAQANTDAACGVVAGAAAQMAYLAASRGESYRTASLIAGEA
jgi:hypothetical protein